MVSRYSVSLWGESCEHTVHTASLSRAVNVQGKLAPGEALQHTKSLVQMQSLRCCCIKSGLYIASTCILRGKCVTVM